MDIVLIAQHILGDSSLTGDALVNADYNGDGSVNVQDIITLINTILN